MQSTLKLKAMAAVVPEMEAMVAAVLETVAMVEEAPAEEEMPPGVLVVVVMELVGLAEEATEVEAQATEVRPPEEMKAAMESSCLYPRPLL